MRTVYRQYCEFTFLDYAKAPIEDAYNGLTSLCSSYVNDWGKFLNDANAIPWHILFTSHLLVDDVGLILCFVGRNKSRGPCK